MFTLGNGNQLTTGVLDYLRGRAYFGTTLNLAGVLFNIQLAPYLNFTSQETVAAGIRAAAISVVDNVGYFTTEKQGGIGGIVLSFQLPRKIILYDDVLRRCKLFFEKHLVLEIQHALEMGHVSTAFVFATQL